MAEQYKQYGQEKAEQAQKTTQGMMGTAQQKTSDAATATQQKGGQMRDMTQI